MLTMARTPDGWIKPVSARTCPTCCARRKPSAAKSQTLTPMKVPMAPTICTKSMMV
jgi:hypothetical protein